MPKYDLTAVYIMASRREGSVYVGVTSDLISRVRQHRLGVGSAFVVRYACRRLVWWEAHTEAAAALARCAELKRVTRKGKLALIESANPAWRDLYDDVIAAHGDKAVWEPLDPWESAARGVRED